MEEGPSTSLGTTEWRVVGVHLPATAVHAPARERSRGLARNGLRCRWASAIWQSSRGLDIFFRANHEAHEPHEESAWMPMASGSEAIPPEAVFFGAASALLDQPAQQPAAHDRHHEVHGGIGDGPGDHPR